MNSILKIVVDPIRRQMRPKDCFVLRQYEYARPEDPGAPGVETFAQTHEVPAASMEVRSEELVRSLPPEHELALVGRVRRGPNPKAFFVQMDGRTSSLSLFEEYLLSFQQTYQRPLHIFDSGRSFHVYGDALITESEMVALYGEMLLAAMPASSIVDIRWIGHGLKKGFSALRITANSSRHTHAPLFVKTLG